MEFIWVWFGIINRRKQKCLKRIKKNEKGNRISEKETNTGNKKAPIVERIQNAPSPFQCISRETAVSGI